MVVKREIVFEESRSLDVPLSGADLGQLAAVVSELSDRAAAAVEGAGYSLDDAVVERILECRMGDGPRFDVEGPYLSDAGRLERQVRQIAEGAVGGSVSAESIRILQVTLRAVVERLS